MIIASATIIIADFVLNGSRNIATNKDKEKSNKMTFVNRHIISGAIIGSTFYKCNFPMLGLTFANFYGFPLKTVILNEFSNYMTTIPTTIMITITV